jgi:hypothetical protein
MTDAASLHSWHVDALSLRRWVDGVAGPPVSVSVESHVLNCLQCQTAVADLAPVTGLDPVWEDVLAEIEVPPPGLAQRVLMRLGMRPSDALVVASAVVFRTAWLAGMITVLVFAVLAATLAPDGGVGLFLLTAPLIPVAGVAAAYGPSADPAYELGQAAPYPGVRLVLLRSLCVLATAVPLTVLAGLLLPSPAVVAVAWLLPATGFVVSVVTAGNWIDPAYAAGVVGTGWVVAVAVAAAHRDPLAVIAPAALAAYAALIAVATIVFIHRLIGAEPSWRLR